VKLEFPTHAEIDLDRIHANLDIIGEAAGTPILPVVKANAYGHGAVRVSKEIIGRGDVEGLCVGTVSEALELRRAGIGGRLIVLGGVFREQAGDIPAHDLEAVVSSIGEARALAARAGGKPVRVHVKINTGMTRLGADPEDAVELFRKISAMKKIAVAGLMTHLADSDRRKGMARRQIALFKDAVSSIRSAGFSIPPCHAANTAAIFLHPESRLDLVRPGIGIYGAQEFGGRDAGFKPALSWRARVVMSREVAKGASVSYGMTWTSPRKRRVAVVCAGYADGYPRAMSNKARAVFKGKLIRQIGTICMDNCLFDVTGVKTSEGDTVTLIGSEGGASIKANDLAGWGGTISYEILCGIGRRVPRVYVKSGKIAHVERLV